MLVRVPKKYSTLVTVKNSTSTLVPCSCTSVAGTAVLALFMFSVVDVPVEHTLHCACCIAVLLC